MAVPFATPVVLTATLLLMRSLALQVAHRTVARPASEAIRQGQRALCRPAKCPLAIKRALAGPIDSEAGAVEADGEARVSAVELPYSGKR